MNAVGASKPIGQSEARCVLEATDGAGGQQASVVATTGAAQAGARDPLPPRQSAPASTIAGLGKAAAEHLIHVHSATPSSLTTSIGTFLAGGGGEIEAVSLCNQHATHLHRADEQLEARRRAAHGHVVRAPLDTTPSRSRSGQRLGV